MLVYQQIFVSFFKIGLFTFGGGYAMLPLFRQELIEKYHFVNEEELLDYYSVGQCTPGVIAVNVATFTGYKIKGIRGAIVATTAIILPSLFLILGLAGILSTFSNNETVNHAFEGIRIGVIALILNEVIKIFKRTVKSTLQKEIFLIVLFLVFLFHFSSVWIILLSMSIGLIKGVLKR